MIITNKLNLPAPWCLAVEKFLEKEQRGDISITQLLSPVQARHLINIHYHEITVDVSNYTWALFGTAVHSVLAQATGHNEFSEEPLKTEINGWIVTGQPDHLDDQGTLTDYKVCRAWAVMLDKKDGKSEWTQQLNYYRYLWSCSGFDAKKLQITAILRDHDRHRAKYDPKYPKSDVFTFEVPRQPIEDTYKALEKRVKEHQLARDSKFPLVKPCSPAERWERSSQWAIKKKSRKDAIGGKVFEDRRQAEIFLEKKGKDFEIEFRQGHSIRCEEYCLALPWCEQGQDCVKTSQINLANEKEAKELTDSEIPF